MRVESILNNVKKLIGLEVDYEAFDDSIILFINGAFSALQQMGIGPSIPFRIQNDETLWDEWSEDVFVVEETKNYVYLHVRKMFDPPSSSYVMEAIDKQIDETAWRLYTHCQKDY